jgi:Divergent InlB B-repeat domain/PASTA domain/NHL repeat
VIVKAGSAPAPKASTAEKTALVSSPWLTAQWRAARAAPMVSGFFLLAAEAARVRVFVLVGALPTSLAVLALAAAPALAARPYESQITEANGTALANPMGLTVDSSNNLWVTDTGSHLVSKFNSSGAYEAQNDGSGSWGTSPYIEGAAFSAAAGKVFVSDSNADDLWGLESSAAYSGTDLNSGLGGGCCYLRVAADNSGGAANGDLYVSTGSSVVRIDGSGAVANFSSSEPYVSGNELTGPFSSAGALAVDSNGNLYVASANKVYIFEPSGTKIGEISEFEGTPLGSINAIAIDPSNENIILAEAGAIEEFSAGGESLAKITEANGGAFSNIQGLAVDSSGTLYAADGANHVVDVFGPASSLSATKFPLEVTVSGNGSVISSPAGISCTSGTCTGEFKEGKTVTLTADPATHNHFVEWSGTDAASCASPTALTCEVTMSEARSLSAGFAPNMRTLTVTPTGPGSVSAATGAISGCEEAGGACGGEYEEGSVVTLTATPAAHNHVTWGAGECKSEPSANQCEVEIAAGPTAVNAAFSVNTHTLTIAHTGLGSVSASEGPITSCSAAGGTCSGIYDETSTITLTATPAAHKHVVWGAGDCKSENGPGNEECEVEIGPSDSVVEVAFPPNKHLLTVTPSGQGSVHADSGTISHCTAGGGGCVGEYIEAATVTLVAAPGAHQAVIWSGCTQVSGDICKVTVGSSDAGLGAIFSQIIHSLTVVKAGSGHGSVSCDGGACASSYPEGTTLNLAATPDSGSTFAGWSGAGCSGTGSCQVTIEADTSVTATFDANRAPPPAEEHCLVPNLAGKTLRRAKAMLRAANCLVGKVSRPKARKGHRLGQLVVHSSLPAAGTPLPAGAEVDLRLGTRSKKMGTK